MAEGSGKEKRSGTAPASQGGGGVFTLIHVAVVVALVGCIVAMYSQNMELSRELGEARAAASAALAAKAAADVGGKKGDDGKASDAPCSSLGLPQFDKLMAAVKDEASRTVDAIKQSNQGIMGTLSSAQAKIEEMTKKGEEFFKKLKKNPMLSSFF